MINGTSHFFCFDNRYMSKYHAKNGSCFQYWHGICNVNSGPLNQRPGKNMKIINNKKQ